MSLSQKGFRKIIRGDQIFYWCVRNDYDDDDRLYLVIQSEDKAFSVSYMLDQENRELAFSPQSPFIIVKGTIFKGLEQLGSCWERFLVPKWEEGKAITPSFVATVIDWCLTPEEVTSVNFRGEILSSRGVEKW